MMSIDSDEGMVRYWLSRSEWNNVKLAEWLRREICASTT